MSESLNMADVLAWGHFVCLSYLCLPVVHVFEVTIQDVDEGVKLLSRCVNDGHASLPDRFQFACLWASFARNFRHPSTSTASGNAISSMQKALPFALTLQLQHSTLAMTCHWTMPHIRSTCVNSRKRSRPSKEGEPYAGLRCITFVLQSINSRCRSTFRAQVCGGQPRP
jgi:hypothetical protein